MNINRLNDDCLLSIFKYFRDLGQVLTLTQVCHRWRLLGKFCLKKVKRLDVSWDDSVGSDECFEILSSTYMRTNEKLVSKINFAEILPNLKFFRARVSDKEINCFEALENVLTTGNPLVGLCLDTPEFDHDPSDPIVVNDDIFKKCNSLKYLYSDDNPFVEKFFTHFEFGPNLKEFGTIRSPIAFLQYGRYMNNLESAEIHCENYLKDILVFVPALLKVDQAPNLKNLFFEILVNDNTRGFEKLGVNRNIQSFVFQLVIQPGETPEITLEVLESILIKFPNCRNLLIGYPFKLTDQNLIKIINMLPNLILLIIKGANWADENIFTAVDRYCKSEGRRVAFYAVAKSKRISLNEEVANLDQINDPFVRKHFRPVISFYQGHSCLPFEFAHGIYSDDDDLYEDFDIEDDLVNEYDQEEDEYLDEDVHDYDPEENDYDNDVHDYLDNDFRNYNLEENDYIDNDVHDYLDNDFLNYDPENDYHNNDDHYEIDGRDEHGYDLD